MPPFLKTTVSVTFAGQKTGGQFAASNLYLAEMESPIKLKTAQFMLTTPDYDWERVDFWVNEGAVLKNNGKIFIAFSASATGACYCGLYGNR